MIQYTIHEVAAFSISPTDAIQLYEKEGLVTPTRNPENGRYNTEQIHRITGNLSRKLHGSIAEIKRLSSKCLHGKISPMVFPVSLIPAKRDCASHT